MPDRPPFPSGASHDSSPRVEVASLAGLRRALEDPGYAAVCFVGPPGQVRADLLYALAEALRARCRLVYLRGSALPPGGFWMRVADALELASGYDARRRVLRLAGDLSRSGQALLLALDDAHALPADTLYALLATARSQPGLLVVLAHGAAERLAGPLPEDVAVVLSGDAPAAPAAAVAGLADAPPPAPVEAALVAGPARESEEPPPAASGRDGAPADLEPTLDRVGSAPGAARAAGAAAGSATLPWEVPPDAPVRSRRRAARGRQRERRRRLAWGASGLALGLLLAAGLEVERWRPLAIGLLGGFSDVAPPHAPPRPSEPPAPVARNAPPDDAASAPTSDTGGGAPAPTTPDVAAAPPDPGEPAARSPLATAPITPPDAAPTPPPSPPSVAPQSAVPPAAAPTPSVAARPTAPPPAPTPALAPTPAVASPLGAPPAAPAPGADARPAPSPAAPPSAALPGPRRRGPLALGALAITADEPVRIEIDGQTFGAAPLAGLRLTRGEHRVLAHFPDGTVAQKTIFLDEQDVAVEFRLRYPAPR